MANEQSTQMSSPVQRWRSATSDWLPPVHGPEATAEALLLILHYSIDFDSWVGRHVTRYWNEVLPSRVMKVTYRVDTLDWWWSEVARSMEAFPASPAIRSELARLLREESQPVLSVMRRESVALVLRVQLIAEAVRGQRKLPGGEVL